MANVKNHFLTADVARRYKRARPRFYHLVAKRIHARCLAGQDHRFKHIVDVGCGTGFSSIALAGLSDSVTAVDVSSAMLSQAIRHPKIRYVRSAAEALPVKRHSADLIAVGLAFHWIDQRAFLREAKRVIRPKGWLVIFNDNCAWKMVGDRKFARVFGDLYSKRFPRPPRNERFARSADLKRFRFRPMRTERIEYAIEFDRSSFVDYVTTISNVIAAVSSDSRRLASARRWLHRVVRPFFEKGRRQIRFDCTIQFAQLIPGYSKR